MSEPIIIRGLEISEEVLKFAMHMQIEINANSHKGDIFNWTIENDFKTWLYEFEYHKSKLITALMTRDNARKIEFAADLGNYLAALANRKDDFDIKKSETMANHFIPQNNKTKYSL